ncbi:MAG: hypothetical protein WC479_09090 [Candidatus Izemoplasmatales bacterium]|jgi:hypothetical protein|nr:hypothetical protein [Candidatus Izemoplasmatales bacterium]MDD3865316.1 hypothetical protein [Candidatus Izemoplasmatales bacterium]
MIAKNIKAIHPKDLVFVILYGVLLPSLMGLLLGLIEYYVVAFIGFSFSFLFFWILAVVTGTLVRKQYETPHLLYTILTGIGIVFAAGVLFTVPILWGYLYDGMGISVFFQVEIYIMFLVSILNPVNWVTNFSFDLVISLLMLAVGTYIGVKRTL